MALYLSPTIYSPDARGMRPIDFKEDVAVNPMDSWFLNAFSASFARCNVLKGEMATASLFQGIGRFILLFLIFEKN